MSPRHLSISVRELVEFVLRSGDLRSAGMEFGGRERAVEGTRAHQRLQKQRPAEYQAEVPISAQIERPTFTLTIRGRIDGLEVHGNKFLIEEIKSVRHRWEGSADPLHLGQAKVYAHLFATQNNLPDAEVRLTYTELDSGNSVELLHAFTADELAAFYQTVIEEYLEWLGNYVAWCNRRDESASRLKFPFGQFRPRQRSLAVAAYRTLAGSGRLFAEAPTGIGKTISVLFPAVKALGEGKLERIFYLTAKTVGRSVAEKAFTDLRSAGQHVRSLTITARDKTCFDPGGQCQNRKCPYALGYYNRLKPALRACLAIESLTRDAIEQVAREHTVCPFELSLDAALWCDAVICDYNYVFDPSARLKRFFDDSGNRYAILIDEAHNLLDRAREMFSPAISESDITVLQKEIKKAAPACSRELKKLAKKLSSYGVMPPGEGWNPRDGSFVRKSAPTGLAPILEKFLEAAEEWLAADSNMRSLLASQEPDATRNALLDCYFKALGFTRTLEIFDSTYTAIYDPCLGSLKLLCLDPANQLREMLADQGSAVFFSATLSPTEFFRENLSGSEVDPVLNLGSPFPPENLCLMVHRNIATTWRARTHTFDAVAESISALVNSRNGNYLIYFPSYEYLNQTHARFIRLNSQISTAIQEPSMSEAARLQFMEKFQPDQIRTLVGFAVMGGIFGEGIDLVGNRLIGVAVVGVGLPQMNLERELIREHFQAQGRNGFDFAYTYPGMNRVLQAVGRLIRSEKDRGVVLLIDQRFASVPYRKLFPEWWQPKFVTAPQQIQAATEEFWKATIQPD